MELLLPAGLLLILGALQPVITGFFTKSTMTSKTKTVVSYAVVAVLAAVWLFASGGAVLVLGAGVVPFIQSLAVAIGLIYTLGQAVYRFLFKGTALAETVENKGVTANESDATGGGFEAEEFPEEELGA